MNETLELINKLIAILGDTVTLGEAKTWAAVEENARKLREEGHEGESGGDAPVL